MWTLRIIGAIFFPALLTVGCSGWEGTSTDSTTPKGTGGIPCGVSTGPSEQQLPANYPRGLHAAGNSIEDSEGNRITLRGVNRSGTEYKCTDGSGIFEGPSDEASVRAIASWNVNAVRVPLNESCWLGINGVSPRLSGENYQRAIVDYVALLHKYSLIPVLELHRAAAGGLLASMQLPMPNADHSVDFWTSVATTFLDDDGVMFEPFNEPFPDENRDNAAAWQCWRDGCAVTNPRDEHGNTRPSYDAVGMQGLVDAIRKAGAKHLLLVGGVQFSNSLTQWLVHQPIDPLPEQNLAAAWHVYNYNGCRSRSCWDVAPASVAAAVPLVATEIGQNDCGSSAFIKPLMEFLDEQRVGYLAWTWNAYGSCVPQATDPKSQPYSLIASFYCPVPNSEFGQVFHDHLQSAP
jgi:hypothetical protein